MRTQLAITVQAIMNLFSTFRSKSNDRWMWSTGKEKLKKPKKAKSRKRRVSDGVEKCYFNPKLAKNVAMDAYNMNSNRVQLESDFHRQLKSKFEVGLAQSKRLKQRADILDFFGMDDHEIPVASFEPPGTSRGMKSKYSPAPVDSRAIAPLTLPSNFNNYKAKPKNERPPFSYNCEAKANSYQKFYEYINRDDNRS